MYIITVIQPGYMPDADPGVFDEDECDALFLAEAIVDEVELTADAIGWDRWLAIDVLNVDRVGSMSHSPDFDDGASEAFFGDLTRRLEKVIARGDLPVSVTVDPFNDAGLLPWVIELDQREGEL